MAVRQITEAALDPIGTTAYYCCGVRAEDARAPRPLCGDDLARRFMTDDAQAIYAPFRRLTAPNATNAARHRIIDDWLREVLSADPRRLIILLGAGFDTRAFRLHGGEWVEIDQPAIIAEKQLRLPAGEAPNPLTRLAVDFAQERLSDKLAPWAGARPVVVMEGVSMYLEPPALRATLETLQQLFPGHSLFCDLMTADFNRRYGGTLRPRIEALGGHFAQLMDHPESEVAACGYDLKRAVSHFSRAVELGALWMPRILLNNVFSCLRNGYRAFWFEARV